MKAVITVSGNDKVGILAKICTACAQANANVEEVTQNIIAGMFAMIMLVDISGSPLTLEQFVEKLNETGKELGVDVRCTRQEMFDAMHRI